MRLPRKFHPSAETAHRSRAGIGNVLLLVRRRPSRDGILSRVLQRGPWQQRTNYLSAARTSRSGIVLAGKLLLERCWPSPQRKGLIAVQDLDCLRRI